jgi:hypothetical protein
VARYVAAWLGEQLRAALEALIDRRLPLALLLLAALLALAAQIPRTYTVDIGQEDGPNGDLPLVGGFYPPEQNDHGSYRWSGEEAAVDLPGVGQRPLEVTIAVMELPPAVRQSGPRQFELWVGGRRLGTLPVRPEPARYRVLLPPPGDGTGDQGFVLRSATFQPPGDRRSIGLPFDRVTVRWGGPALPAWRSTLLWLLAAGLVWLGLRLAGWSPGAALAGLLPAQALLALAAALDPPRTAMGAEPALRAIGWALLLIVLLRPALPHLAARLAIPLDARALRWLLVLAALAFGLRYGGKIYPFSMPGDIGFHDNRFSEVIQGRVLLLSRNRGVDFPYPPVLYLLLAPLTLLGDERRWLLRFAGALLDAASPLLVYTLACAGLGRGRASRRGAGLLAAGLYSLCAAGFMTTWWNFSTHIFTQAAHLLLVSALVLIFRRTEDEGRRTKDESVSIHPRPLTPSPPHPLTLRSIGVLTLLQLLVYLGHFGFWMNTTLLFGMMLVWMALAARRGALGWGLVWTVLASVAAAELLTALCFYSGYAGLFLEQIRATSAGGLNGLAGREAVPVGVLWETLWEAGFRTHYGLFPVLLVPVFLGLCAVDARLRPSSAALLPLMVSTLLIGLAFAALPFLTGSTLTTRWLMFAGWAVAVGAAAVAGELWQRGLAARLVVVLVGGYVVWISASQWLGALAWRIRPPEPF